MRALLLVAVLFAGCTAFAPIPLTRVRNNKARKIVSLNADLTFAFDKFPGLTKNIVIVLAFGGGLIPATIAANKSMFSLISGEKVKDEAESVSSKSSLKNLNVANIDSEFVSESVASGPDLPVSPLLFSKTIKLADVCAIIGRIQNVDSLCKWSDLPSTKVEGLAVPSNPPMWLPRQTFKSNLRKAKFGSWPIDSNGDPIGGNELRDTELKRISSNKVVIPDAALDAVFDTWAWGASIATPDKVENQLRSWRKTPSTFDLGAFQAAAVGGRSITGLAIITFVVLQVSAFGVLFIAPFLREIFNVDIGFGSLGSCAADGCVDLRIF